MMRPRMVGAVVALGSVLGAAPLRADAEYPSVDKQMKLDEFMPMEKVRALLGDPDATGQSMCGGSTGKPWSCRTWIYRDERGREFRLLFQKGDAGWVVNSWSS